MIRTLFAVPHMINVFNYSNVVVNHWQSVSPRYANRRKLYFRQIFFSKRISSVLKYRFTPSTRAIFEDNPKDDLTSGVLNAFWINH